MLDSELAICTPVYACDLSYTTDLLHFTLMQIVLVPPEPTMICAGDRDMRLKRAAEDAPAQPAAKKQANCAFRTSTCGAVLPTWPGGFASVQERRACRQAVSLLSAAA